MIQIRTSDWYTAWVQLHLCYNDPSQIDARFGTRAVSFDNEITVNHNDSEGLDHTIVGYTNYKLSLFKHRYIVPGMKEKIATTLKERMEGDRKLTVISYPFKGDDGAHTQGPCVINMIVTLTKTGTLWEAEFDIQIRMGEITRRMLVDFLQFTDIINYFMSEMREIDPHVEFKQATLHAKALYAEPMSLVIAEHLFANMELYRSEHWLHRAVQTKIESFKSTDHMKFKRGRRIRNHVQKMKGEGNGANP